MGFKFQICKMYFTYITTNPGKNVLYVGMTNTLKRRIREHEANRGKRKLSQGDTIVTSWFILKLMLPLWKPLFEKRK